MALGRSIRQERGLPRDLESQVAAALCPGGFALLRWALGDQNSLDHPLQHEPARASPNPEPVGEWQDRAIGTGGCGRENQSLGGGEAWHGRAPCGVVRCGDRSAPTTPSPAGRAGRAGGPNSTRQLHAPSNACPAGEVQQKETGRVMPLHHHRRWPACREESLIDFRLRFFPSYTVECRLRAGGSRSAPILAEVPRFAPPWPSARGVGGRRPGQRATAIWLRSSASSMREELCARRRVPSSPSSSPYALVPKASTCQ
jgi:hypothetical protein